MRDGFSLDQIRAFIAAAEEGSFSAAARRLGCVQSVVSDLIRRLEEESGLQLFSRATRSPTLTPAGALLLIDAKAIADAANQFHIRSTGMSLGLEPELCVVVDVYFPFQVVAEAVQEFQATFAHVPLRLYVEVLGGALAPVLEGRASFAIVGDPALGRPKIASERITSVELVVVAAPKHPLASIEGKIPHEALKRHVQLVLTERTSTVSVNDHNVISAQTWRLADFFAKHKFLLMGLGWGAIPRHAVEEDIASGRLKVLSIEDSSQTSFLASMSAVYRVDAPPGPAARWLIERLKSGSAA